MFYGGGQEAESASQCAMIQRLLALGANPQGALGGLDGRDAHFLAREVARFQET